MTDVFTHVIDEVEQEGARLGRHVKHDPRSRDFQAEEATRIVDVLHDAVGLPLDQGNRGSCTAQALCGALNSSPDRQHEARVFTEGDANHFYDLEIIEEGYNPQTDDPGGTGLDICRVAKAQGLIRLYRHAFSFDSVLRSLVLRPGMAGVNWYSNFDRPPGNVLTMPGPNDFIRGGHEFVLDQIITADKLVGAWQSWGPGWGKTGRFWIPYGVLEFLLSSDQQGDYTIPYV